MLEYSDYISDIPDNPHQNFAQVLEQVSIDHADKDAILYRCNQQKEFIRWTYSRYGEECRRVARGLLKAGLKKATASCFGRKTGPSGWRSGWEQ